MESAASLQELRYRGVFTQWRHQLKLHGTPADVQKRNPSLLLRVIPDAPIPLGQSGPLESGYGLLDISHYEPDMVQFAICRNHAIKVSTGRSGALRRLGLLGSAA